ncbi:MAG: putative cation-transporting ATPase F [Candidatus Binatia bacterium]|nr:MAG: putative cation-transporting ATPase F [Candidatus Binatia bacterium]
MAAPGWNAKAEQSGSEPFAADRHGQAHSLAIADLLILLETDVHRGLTDEEAERRLTRFGPNVLPPPRKLHPLQRFLLQFHNPLIYVLLAAGAVTLALREFPDASVIFGVVLVNAVVGFIQEMRAERALEALLPYLQSQATVIRSGRKRRIAADGLVPGDLVVLEPGDKVPADVRIVSAYELQIDESLLTGESVPVLKHAATLPAEAALADRSNMAFCGTLVTSGHGAGIVVATGAATELGRIHQLVASTEGIDTPLIRKIRAFSRALTVAILALAALTFAVGLWRGQAPSEVFLAAVALAVAAIPEGLPAAMTITLALGVSRMARRHAIIRKMPAVEALGSTTVICSDKTGTLTENQMTVSAIWAGGERFEVTGTGYNPDGYIVTEFGVAPPTLSNALLECLRAGVLCNDSRLEKRRDKWVVMGDPTEAALLVSARKAGFDPEGLIQAFVRLGSVPFESQRQYMATLHRAPTGGSVLYVKGAVERVVAMSRSMLDADGNEIALDSKRVFEAAEALAANGLRVLAFARRIWSEPLRSLDPSQVRELVFVGLQGMFDPPRVEAASAVRSCHQAGIAVKMVTGDHAVTAAAIARRLQLTGSSAIEPIVMTGAELARCSESELPELADRAHVFARVAPEQKLQLVRALQARKHVVAVTGDGVNDAAALKQADIGVAMGSGTEVAKEAAAMVLTDDNFRSIVAAVEEGRGVFDNLTKFIVWTLPTNLGEGLVLLAAIAAGTLLPILPVQVLWINMATAICLGMMLAFEPKERDIMCRPPRDPEAPILTPLLVMRTVVVSVLMLAGAFGIFMWEQANGRNLAEARTAAVNVFVLVETFYLFNCRSLTDSPFTHGLFSNTWANVGAALMILLQLAFTYLPQMQYFFHSASISTGAWARAILVGLLTAVIVEIEKWLRRSLTKRSPISHSPSEQR